MFLYLLFILICLCLIHLLFNFNKRARMIKRIPGGKDLFIIGNTMEFIVPPEELFPLRESYAKQYDGIYRFWGFPLGAVAIYNPNDIETILSNSKFNDKSFMYAFLKPWLREGLLLSKGLKWRQRRKILTNAFHFNILNQFCVTLEENSQKLVNLLARNIGEQVDVVPILSEYTLQSICETSMGIQLDTETSGEKSYKNSIHEIGKLICDRFVRIYLYPDFIFNLTSRGKTQKKYLNKLHNFTKRVVNEKRQYFTENTNEIKSYLEENNDIFMSNRKNKIAMLDLLLLAEREGQIDGTGIQEEVDTFMFEGHDTTGSALTYCFMSIANHKNIQLKIFKELNGIFGDDSDRVATMQDLTKMQYLECCIKESLRLYPAVHFISRQLNDEVTLSNYTVPAGTYCHILIYELHRRPSLYEDPLKFDPDRFLPENSVGRHPYAYIPFSAGARNCIGLYCVNDLR